MEEPKIHNNLLSIKAIPSKQFKKKIFLAYMAGLLDGEGSLFCLKFKGKSRENWNFSYRPVMTINNTHYGVLEFIQKRCGGEIEKTDTRGRKDMYRLKWVGRNILPILSKLQPYLIIKKEQAKIMIGLLMNIIRNDNGGGKKLSIENLNYRTMAKEKLSLLNGQLQRLSERTPILGMQ